MNGQTARPWLDSFIHAIAVLGHGLAGVDAEDAAADAAPRLENGGKCLT
jgi:hypothetical protein